MRSLVDIAIVAWYEVSEAARTRLLQLVILAYTGGIAGAVWIFVQLLKEAERPIVEQLGVPPTERPGALMGRLLENGDARRMISGILGTDDVAGLLDRPLLALWIGAVSMWLLPAVLTFAASGSVASEVRSRSIRYLLCRTGRLEIGLGKLAGQLLLALLAAGIGSAVAWALGMTLMVGNPPVGLALELAERTVRASLFALPFAGIGLAASQWVASPNGARFLAFGMFVGTPIATGLLKHWSGPDFLGRVADLAGLFLPLYGWFDFWSTAPGAFLVATAHAAGLAVIYAAAGQVVFARRDL